jgi:5-methylcytosine-specific restriction protein A
VRKQTHKEKRARRLSDSELRNRVAGARKQPGYRNVTGKQYERDPFVAELARREAKGTWQLSLQQAPFKRKNGEPYLETHHIVGLSREGLDTIENTVALCPNCHRKLHILDFSQDVHKLKARKLDKVIL